jgi:OFA family oxalate/formate antiporter-like MFS transporter
VADSSQTSTSPGLWRWAQLAFGVFCMVQIANLQYGWTLFVDPINDKFHFGRAAIQWAFTIFIVTETWLVPVEGWLVDRFGPRVVVLGGGVLVGIAWVMNSYATSLPMFYAAAAIGGTGAGAVYGTAVGNSLKWFPDKRGMAAGITAAGFGAGAAFTVIPIANMIKNTGYQSAFLTFGLIQGALVLVFGAFLRAPRSGEVPLAAANTRVHQTRTDSTPREAIKTRTFWIMYAVFFMVATGGIMATAQLGPIAKDFKVANMPVNFFGFTVVALPFALSLDRVMNGLTRPFCGWISDHIGRENTMFIAFLIEGIGILLLLRNASDARLFIILTGLVFFAWGEIYSLFPATVADMYGRKYCTTIYGILYTAKGCAAVGVPLSAMIVARSGWSTVFYIVAVLNFLAAFIALFVLKPASVRAHQAPLPDALGISRI